MSSWCIQASDAPDARAQWAAEMRLKLSPPAMLEADGSIRQSYFKPKHVRHLIHTVNSSGPSMSNVQT
jgi:hypothetical protein